MESCYHCKSLKKRLKNDDISFTDVDIESNKDLWNDIVEQTGHNVVPSVFIGNNDADNGPIYIPGKDFEDEDTIVEIIKSHF
jgi:glutaredoxin